MPIRTLIIIVLAAAVVSGCGRRGGLEAPEATAAGPQGVAPAGTVAPADPPPPAAPPPEPERRFFLDFLL